MVESTQTFDKIPSIMKLKEYYDNTLSKKHLKELLNDNERNDKLRAELGDDIILDFTHSKIDA